MVHEIRMYICSGACTHWVGLGKHPNINLFVLHCCVICFEVEAKYILFCQNLRYCDNFQCIIILQSQDFAVPAQRSEMLPKWNTFEFKIFTWQENKVRFYFPLGGSVVRWVGGWLDFSQYTWLTKCRPRRKRLQLYFASVFSQA